MDAAVSGPTPEPGPPRLPGWLRWLLGGLGLVALLVVAFAVWMVAAFSGGLDDLLDLSKPREGDGRVVRAREAATPRLVADSAAITSSLVRDVPGLGGVLATTITSECAEGQHNWKIDDDYDLRCTASRASAFAPLPLAGADDLGAVEAALTRDGWTAEDGGLPGLGQDRAGAPLRALQRYRRGTDVLTVTAIGPGAEGDYRLERLPAFEHRDGSRATAAEIVARGGPRSITVFVELERAYFDE